jgi:FkbM family methyltransferase
MLERILRRPVVFTDSRGLRYVLHPGENAQVYFAHGGNYEVAETRLCERLLKHGDIVIDGGANIGLYSLLFGRLVGSEGRVVAFEPDPVNAARLLHNLELNDLQFVEIAEVALWREGGRKTLHRFDPAFGPWHSLGEPELAHPFRRGELAKPVDEVEVDVITLDGYCEGAGIDHISLLKLDLEGAEPDALIGSESLLSRQAIDVVLFEVSLPQLAALGHEPDDSLRTLARHGYETYAIEADGTVGEATASSADRYENYVALPAGSPHAPGA